MSVKSTQSKYGVIAVIIHWLSVVLILALLATGFRADGMEDAASKTAFLRIHVPLGATILLLTLARVCWWLFADNKPPSIPMPTWQDRASRTVHVLFYVVILGMAASGIAMIAASGAASVIFGGSSEALADFWEYPPRLPHGLGGRAIIVLFVFHAGAALYHHFLIRDGLLRRMWF